VRERKASVTKEDVEDEHPEVTTACEAMPYVVGERLCRLEVNATGSKTSTESLPTSLSRISETYTPRTTWWMWSAGLTAWEKRILDAESP